MAEERQANITVELAPDGVHVYVEYTGGLSSVSQVVERLRSLKLVQEGTQRSYSNGGARQAPVFDGDADPCCPTHNRKLKGPNQWGKMYCSAREGDAYCKYTYKPE